jgi:large subunit ribosomal protein L21
MTSGQKNPAELLLHQPKPLTFALLIFEIMFAIVKIAGQQFRVQKDQTLYVPHVNGNAGDALEFSEVLLTHNDGNLSTGGDVKATVKAEIVTQVLGDKVIAFKMKRRKGFRKKHGHRTRYTQIRISDIV